MGKTLYITLGASNHTDKKREENDFHATDPIAIDKLLEVEDPNYHIWECACGQGHLSERLTKKGFYVFSADIVDRGYKRLTMKEDFLKRQRSPFNSSFDIITNPPYKYAKEFVLKALELLPRGSKCFMFLKLTFLEGKTRFKELFNKNPPKIIHVFSERIMCAKNGDFKTMKAGGGSAIAYAWFVWQKGYQGKTVIDWI